MLTVNDLIGLNYSNLKNPQPADMAPGLSYQVDPAAQGGRRLVSDIKPAIDRGLNSIFGPDTDSNIPEFAQVDMGATGTIPMAANINTQPLIGETSGIAPLLTADTNMPLDYEEMIQRDDSIITPQRKTSGLETLLQLAISAAIPGAGFLMRGPKGLAGLNRRLQQSDFGQSSSLVDYLNRKRRQSDKAIRNMVQTRGIQKKIDSGMYDDKDSSGIGDRGRGQITSSSPPPRKTSTNYKTASYDRRTTKY